MGCSPHAQLDEMFPAVQSKSNPESDPKEDRPCHCVPVFAPRHRPRRRKPPGHAGWNFALNRQLGDKVFHASSLVNFRNRLDEHQPSTLGFTIILNALEEAGLVSRQSRQRLASIQMFGRVARMSRLD